MRALSWRPSRRISFVLIAGLVLAGAWLTVPATGNQFLQRMLGGGRGRGPQGPARHQPAEEPPRRGPELIDSPLDVQGAPRLPRASIQQSVQTSNGQSTLDQLVAQAIDLTSRRYLDLEQNPPYTPWQIIHGTLALREDYILKRGDEYIRAIDYISNGAEFMGDAWFQRTSTGGRARPYNNVPYAFEGHINQTLALMCMSNLPLDHQIKVEDGGYVTMRDMVRTAQHTVNEREEITWTLWFLTHYTDQLTTWTNYEGESWSMERMIRIQIEDQVTSAPCGGCHGLFALAYARNAYLVQHGELRGVWLEADRKVQQYIASAQTTQNGDGSFSSKYFKSRGTAVDLDERIRTSGHMFEWLMMALPSSRLEEEWVQRGAARIATDLINSVNDDTEMGGMYHACHSLVLYQQRMEQLRARQQQQSPAPQELADVPQATRPVEEPAPLPSQSDVAELQRPDDIVVQNPVNPVQEPPVTNEPSAVTVNPQPMPGVPLIVGDIEPEEPASPEPALEQEPEVVPDVTPPLILMPELLVQEEQSVTPTVPVQPTETQPDESATGPQVPLIVTDEPSSLSAAGPNVPLVVDPEPMVTSQETETPPTVAQEQTPPSVSPESEATPEQEPRQGLSFITPNGDQPAETQVPAPAEPGDNGDATARETTPPTEPRVFTLTMPESNGNHKPQSATSDAPVTPGSRPVTGATQSPAPR